MTVNHLPRLSTLFLICHAFCQRAQAHATVSIPHTQECDLWHYVQCLLGTNAVIRKELASQIEDLQFSASPCNCVVCSANLIAWCLHNGCHFTRQFIWHQSQDILYDSSIFNAWLFGNILQIMYSECTIHTQKATPTISSRQHCSPQCFRIFFFRFVLLMYAVFPGKG